MRLRSLSLEQFRSYERLELTLPEGDVHLLTGPNGAGKTNILESIVLLSLLKSFQGVEEEDLVAWGRDFYRIRAVLTEDTGEERTQELVSVLAPRRQKAAFMNDVKMQVSDVVGRLPTVTFLPQDLELFSGAPAQRRRFLDQLLCQVEPEYLIALAKHQRVLKQRNTLLRRIREGAASEEDLDPWDHALAREGAFVTLRRLELLEMLQCTLCEELIALGECWSDVRILFERKGESRTLDEAVAENYRLLRASRDRDLLLQSTGVGPHREDWHIVADGHALQNFASRGQQRTVVLALLFLQVSFVELRRGEKPVILLDDVFSELDDAHQTALLRSLEGHQVLITATHVPKELQGATVHAVEKGVVTEGVVCRE